MCANGLPTTTGVVAAAWEGGVVVAVGGVGVEVIIAAVCRVDTDMTLSRSGEGLVFFVCVSYLDAPFVCGCMV
eukprot:939364-Rhodomonas_salina.1